MIFVFARILQQLRFIRHILFKMSIFIFDMIQKQSYNTAFSIYLVNLLCKDGSGISMKSKDMLTNIMNSTYNNILRKIYILLCILFIKVYWLLLIKTCNCNSIFYGIFELFRTQRYCNCLFQLELIDIKIQDTCIYVIIQIIQKYFEHKFYKTRNKCYVSTRNAI